MSSAEKTFVDLSDLVSADARQLTEIRERLVNTERRLVNTERKINMLLQREITLTPAQNAAVAGESEDQHFGSRTYAQHGDDIVILNIFDTLGIAKPSYLDIGAHHPFEISNTALLYARGCRGVNVEANPNLIDAFYRQRPEDINLNVGVADQPGTMTFFKISDQSGLNTFDPKRAAEIVERGKFGIKEQIPINVVTISQIVQEHCGGVFPDLLTIDVEGFDFPILKSIDYNDSFPKVIVVECNSESALREISTFLHSKNYMFYFRASVNLFFLHNTLKHRLFEMNSPDEDT